MNAENEENKLPAGEVDCVKYLEDEGRAFVDCDEMKHPDDVMDEDEGSYGTCPFEYPDMVWEAVESKKAQTLIQTPEKDKSPLYVLTGARTGHSEEGVA